MPTTFRDWFAAATPHDPAGQRLARILKTFLRLALVSLGFLLIFFFTQGSFAAIVGRWVTSGMLGVTLLAWGLIRLQRPHLAALLLVTGVGGILLLSAALSGGVSNPAYLSFVVIVLTAGLLLGQRASLAMAVIGAVAGVGLLYYEQTIARPAALIIENPALFWIIGMIIFTWAALVFNRAIYASDDAFRAALDETANRAQAEAALRRQVKELTILNAAAQAAAQALDEDQLIRDVTGVIGEGFFPEHFGVMLVNPVSGTLMRHPSYRIEPEFSHINAQPGEGIVGQVAQTGKPYRVGDTRRDPVFLDVIPNIRSELCVPIVSPTGVLGVINVESTEVEAFSADDERLLVTLAGQMANAIQRIRLSSALQHSENRYQELFDRVPQGLFQTDAHGRVVEANPAVIQIMGFPDRQSMLGASVFDWFEERERRRNFITQVRLHGIVKNFVVSVHRYDGSSICIEANATRLDGADGKPVAYDGSVQDVTARVQAEEQLRRYAQRLEGLRAVGQAVLNANQPGEIAQAALEQVRALLGCRRASLTLFDPGRELLTVFSVDLNEATNLGNGNTYPLKAFSGFPILASMPVNYIPDLTQVTEPSETSQILLAGGIRSYCSIALRSHGELIGALNLGAEAAGAFSPEKIQIATEAAESLAVALQNASLLKESQQQAVELGILYDAALALNTQLETTTLLSQLSSHIERILKPDTVMVALVIPETEEFKIALAIENGAYISEWENFRKPLTSGGLTGWVMHNQASLLVNDLLHDPLPVQPVHGANPTRAWLGVPLKSRDRLLGAISIQSFQPGAFTRASQRFLESLAAQVAVALENADLFEAERKRSQELASVASLSSALRTPQTRAEILAAVLYQVMADFHANGVALLMRNTQDQESLVEQALGSFAHWRGRALDSLEITAGQVLDCRSPYLNNDTKTNPPSPHRDLLDSVSALACAPLLVQEYSIGLLCLGRQTAFTRQEMRSLSTIADIAASAIRRISLHEQTERSLRRVQALHRIDQAITSSVDLRLVLQILLEQVTEHLKVDAAAILLLDAQTQILRAEARRGFHTGALRHTTLHLGQSYAGYAALQRQILHIADLERTPGELARATLLTVEGFVSYVAVPLIARGEVKGVLEIFNRRRLDPDRDWQDFLEALAGQAAIAIENASLIQELRHSNQELALAYDITLEGWSGALELRDHETEGHSQRVTRMTEQLARCFGMSDEQLVHVRRGALLHDIGKMGIPDSILFKNGPLDEQEWVRMREHPGYAHKLLTPIQFLRPALEIPYSHHERWDGRGYPQGLRGEEIPMAARIFSVVDVFDALSSDRPYRPAWSRARILAYLQAEAGNQFDPEVVNKFLDLINTNGLNQE